MHLPDGPVCPTSICVFNDDGTDSGVEDAVRVQMGAGGEEKVREEPLGCLFCVVAVPLAVC